MTNTDTTHKAPAQLTHATGRQNHTACGLRYTAKMKVGGIITCETCRSAMIARARAARTL